MAGRPLPDYVEAEFDAYLKRERMEVGFLRLRCEQCHAEKLVAFSCKKRGFCPSCGARRMAETVALLVDEVLPARPLRQWVLSLPMTLCFLLATRPAVLTDVLGVDRPHRRCQADPAFRLGAEPQRTPAHDLRRWRVSDRRRRSAGVLSCASAGHERADDERVVEW